MGDVKVWAWGQGAQFTYELPSLGEALSNALFSTRIITVVGNVPVFHPHFLDGLTKLDSIRVIALCCEPPEIPPFRARNVTVFTSFPKVYPLVNSGIPRAALPILPVGVKVLVVNLTFTLTDYLQWGGQLDPLTLPESVEDVTIIFKPITNFNAAVPRFHNMQGHGKIGDSSRGPQHHKYFLRLPRPETPTDLLEDVAAYLTKTEVTFTLVDPPSGPIGHAGQSDGNNKDSKGLVWIRRIVGDHLVSAAKSADEVASILKTRLKIMSLEQYRDHVGEEAFHLNTDP